ncbi:MAG: hypothetical protein E3J21_09765 [Anaerolineales bacterium]|nr:MAG: hypothetical protein E3J21_09765 [Anaerolineales bacterium]
MKPQKLKVATDYRPALLWLMARLESARMRDVMAAFEEAFGDLIPAEHRETNKSGRIKWEHYVVWSRFDLVGAGLMGSGGRGIWTITTSGNEWLLGNPDADSADLSVFIRQESTESELGFRWRGKQYTISKRALLSRARRLLKEGPPKEALRYKGWAVFVGDQPVSVKWLFSLATGADYNEFNSPTARRALSKIGIEARPVGQQTPPVPQESPPRIPRAERKARRQAFFEQVAEFIPSYLPEQARHGDIRVHEGTNYMQLVYPEFPGAHYDLILGRANDQLAIYFESSREKNMARLAVFESHQEGLSAKMGHPVIADPRCQSWTRVELHLSRAPWTSQQAEIYAKLMGRFVDATFSLLRQAFDAVPPGRRRRRAKTATDSSAWDGSRPHVILEERLDQIRHFLQGRAPRPSDEVLCDWVQFCYTFELFAEGYELFRLIDPSAVNDWLYERTKRLAKVCHIRSG